MKNIFIGFVFIFFVLILWESLCLFQHSLNYVLPCPSLVFERLMEHKYRFFLHTSITLKEMLLALILAIPPSFFFAWLMNQCRSTQLYLQPLFILIQCIPMFTLAPLMILFFGWSLMSIVFPASLMIFFPLTITIFKGLQAVPLEFEEFFNSHQATTYQKWTQLKLPWAIPYIFSGLRLAAGIAGVAAIAGEWAGAQEGLGVLMVESRRDADLETHFAALICLSILSCSLYGSIVWLETLFDYRRSSFFYRRRQLAKSVLRGFFLLFLGSLSIFTIQSFRPSLKSIKLMLDWTPNPNHVPLYVGIEKGFFKSQGIDLQLLKLLDPSYSTGYLLTGECDLAIDYMSHVLRLGKKDPSIKMIGSLVKETLNGIIYRQDAGITSIQDLNNKVIGCCLAGKDSLMLEFLLKKNQVFPSQKLYVGFDIISSLATKQVDAVYGAYWNIEVEHLKSMGLAIDHFSLSELGVPPYQELIFVAKLGSDFASDDFIHRFQHALQQSINYSRLHPEEAFNAYLAQQSDKSAQTASWERLAWFKTVPLLANEQNTPKEQLMTYNQWLREHNLL